MPLPKSLIQAWAAWQQADAPIANSRLRRHMATTYEIEVQLDHLNSYLYTMGLNIIGGNSSLNYAKQIDQELVELNAIKMAIEKCEIPVNEKLAFTDYVAVTEKLYQEIKMFLNT